MLKLRASDLAMRIATGQYERSGYDYIKDYRVEQLLRDAKITNLGRHQPDPTGN
jgi:alkylation response protein AidB-like acyl-CoA dehydrogenase